MATSDNVVRAGLTPKAKDVETLVRMLTYNFGPPNKIQPTNYHYNGSETTHTKIFNPPIPEFAIMQTTLSAGSPSACFSEVKGPSIIVVIDGAAHVTSSFDSKKEIMQVSVGHVYFVPSQVALEVSTDRGVTLYRAYCEV
jgi:mannose-6-phosphate isomerase